MTEFNIKDLDLSLPKRFAVASGHILNDLSAGLWYSYILLYFENVVGLSSNYAAYLCLVGHISDGISTSIVGYEADHTTHFVLLCKSYGRCKTWNLFGVIVVALSFPFIFSPCIDCEGTADWAKLVYYAPIIAVSQIGWASSQISHLALIPKINPDELVRTELLSIRYGFTVVSNITIFILAWQTFGFAEGATIDSSYASSFRNICLYAVAIGLFFSAIFHLTVKEHTDEYVKKCMALAAKAQRVRQNAGPRTRRDTGQLTLSRSHNVKILNRSGSQENDDFDEVDIRRTILENLPDLDNDSGSESEESDRDRSVKPIPPPIVRGRQRTTSTMENAVAGVSVVVNNFMNTNEFEEIQTGPSSLSTKNLSLGRDHMSPKDWLTLPQYWVVTLIYTMTRLSVNVTQIYVPLFLQKSLKLAAGTVATIPLTMYIFSFLTACFMRTISRLLGRQFSYILGASLAVCGSICVLTLELRGNDGFVAKYGIYGVAALLGSGASVILVTSLSITADLIGNNVESGAFVYGTISFSDKLACGLAVTLINSMVPCQKDDSVDCTPSDKAAMAPFYRHVLAYSCGGSALVGVVGVIFATLLIFLRRGARRRQREYQQIPSSN